MANITELIAALVEAKLKAGEADAAMEQAKEMMGRSLDAMTEAIENTAMVLGDSNSLLVSEALNSFQQAQNLAANNHAGINEIQNSIRAGAERAETYIGLLGA